MGENFDPIFTRGKTDLTPPDANSRLILENMNGDEFKGFSYVNPYYTPFKSEDLLLIP